MTDYEERAAQIVIVMLALLGMALAIGVLTAPVASAAPRVGDCLPGLIAPVFGVTPLTDPDMAALRAVPVVGAARAIYGDDPHWEAGGERLELLTGWDVWLDRAGIANIGRADAYLEVLPLAGRNDALLAVAADSRLADADGAWHGCAAWLLDAAGWYGWLAGDGEPSPALPEATRRNAGA